MKEEQEQEQEQGEEEEKGHCDIQRTWSESESSSKR